MKEFTKENRTRLEALYGQLSFDGQVLSGKFGANQLNPFELLQQTTPNTLRGLHKSVKAELQSLSEADEWTQTLAQTARTERMKVWEEFLNLLIGYKLNEELEATKEYKRKQLKAQIEQLTEEGKTPEQRLKDLQAELDKI